VNLSKQPSISSAAPIAQPEGIQAPLHSPPQSKPRCATFLQARKRNSAGSSTKGRRHGTSG
jgi:hypothetical protein